MPEKDSFFRSEVYSGILACFSAFLFQQKAETERPPNREQAVRSLDLRPQVCPSLWLGRPLFFGLLFRPLAEKEIKVGCLRPLGLRWEDLSKKIIKEFSQSIKTYQSH